MTDRSVEAGNITNSIVITGDHNRAWLSFGDAFKLPLDRRQCAAPVRTQPGESAIPDLLSLLAADAGKLPLVGSADILADLRGWLDHEVDVSVKTIIARAGSGKTRLAVELCKAIDGAAKPAQSGWLAGFVRPGDLAEVAEKLTTTDCLCRTLPCSSLTMPPPFTARSPTGLIIWRVALLMAS